MINTIIIFVLIIIFKNIIMPTTLFSTITDIIDAKAITASATNVYASGMIYNNDYLNFQAVFYLLTTNSKTLFNIFDNIIGSIIDYMTCDGNFIYFTSGGEFRAYKFNISTKVISNLRDLSSPSGIAVYNGIVYVAQSNIISTLNSSDMSVININFITGLNQANGLTFDNQGYLWVCQNGNNKVSKYDINNASKINEFSVNSPTCITYNSDYLFITATINGTPGIYQYDLTGNYIELFSNPPTEPNQTVFFNNNFYAASQSGSSVYVFDYTVACYDKNTKILCLNGNKEEYITISELKKGDLVKTYSNNKDNHTYQRIELIDSRNIIGDNNKQNKKNSLYKHKYPVDNFDNLIITGGHSILVDNLSEEQKDKQKLLNFNRIIENKYLSLAMCSDDFEQIIKQPNEIQTVYHLVLENNNDDEDENDDKHYGIWANGILSESCIKKYFIKYLQKHF